MKVVFEPELNEYKEKCIADISNSRYNDEISGIVVNEWNDYSY